MLSTLRQLFFTTKILSITLVSAVFIFVGALELSTATAHGGSIYLAKNIHDYEIIMRASPPQPRIGTWHLSFEISQSNIRIGPEKATVFLETVPANENGDTTNAIKAQTISSLTSTYDDQLHDADIEFQKIGKQMLTISVLDSNQSELLFYQTLIDVKKPSSGQTVILSAITLPIAIGLLWITVGWLRKKR